MLDEDRWCPGPSDVGSRGAVDPTILTTSLEHEIDIPPWRRVELTLMATSRAIRRAYDVRLGKLGLNLSEARALAFIDQNGPMAQTHLADRLGIGRPGTGAVIDALEYRQLVERKRHPVDRRVRLVALTTAAAPVVGQIRITDERLRNELWAGIGRAERRALAQTLVRLQQSLSRIFAEDTQVQQRD